MTETLPIRRALLSVSDKTGLLPLAAMLAAHGAELVSTGGTAAELRAHGFTVRDVATLSGFPEILDGRVKTLVPQIHAGILARRDLPEHRATIETHAIDPIDLVAVTLYPFEATAASGAPPETCIETIDIGGPAMIRSAAKNFAHVAVLTDPAQYPALITALERSGGTTHREREALAHEAFARTAAYDAAIAAWFSTQRNEPFPQHFTLAGRRHAILRYGENPHQRAAFYAGAETGGLATARQIQGKALSHNNLLDADAALDCAAAFDEPVCVIVKHTNPCGVATSATLAQAWDRALATDPTSAFGGIVALNRPLDEDTAGRIATIFTELIIAPDATPSAMSLLAPRKNLRLLLTGPAATAAPLTVRSLATGFLVQDRDQADLDPAALRPVTTRHPTPAELADLVFAFRVAKHVKSNAIVFARDGATLGIGAGQMSRVDSARLAASKAERAGLALAGSVMASDAFFPFPDGLDPAIAAGASAVIQPGGSVRDAEVIEAANRAGLAMVFTGLRHFRH